MCKISMSRILDKDLIRNWLSMVYPSYKQRSRFSSLKLAQSIARLTLFRMCQILAFLSYLGILLIKSQFHCEIVQLIKPYCEEID